MMGNYDFSTLNYSDFEKLVCDLLNCHFSEQNGKAFFRSFKEGKDQGIDLLHSTREYNHSIVAQVKHYVKTPKSKLFGDLKTNEKPKVDDLKPSRYIFVTSLPLNINDKKKIKNIFEPHIKDLGDIFGRDDLNDILRLNRAIEENHYKLWFSSTLVLSKILNYKYSGRRNEFTEEILKMRFRLFVVTNDYHKAKASLERNKFIIISGNPGVGKTTLSDMIIYDFIKEDFQLNIIYENIKEIENTLLIDDSKQVFYFDDFLGHTAAEINKLKSTDSVLIRLLSRIEKQKNKYIILNTRKFILSPFLEESEKLRNFNLLKSETKIELVSYTYGIKRKILDNHILESELNSDLKMVLYKLAHTVCSHTSFTPRIIEFFTGSKVKNFNSIEFQNFIISNLENPEEIWNHAYRKQISNYDRFLLNTLYSLNGSASKHDLEKAYNSRLNFEVNNNNFIKPLDSFYSSLKNLNDGFINIDMKENQNISLINPSLIDYLDYFFSKNHLEKERIFLSSTYIEQWYFFYQPFQSKKNILPNKLLNHVIEKLTTGSNNEELLSINNEPNERNFKILLFYYFFNSEKKINFIVELLKNINDWSFIDQNQLSLFLLPRFLAETTNVYEINDVIINYDWRFYILFLQNQNSLDELIDNFNLITNHYEFDYFEILNDLDISKSEEIEEFEYNLKTMFDLEEKYTYNYLKDRNTEIDYHLIEIERMTSYRSFIKSKIVLNIDLNLESLLNFDWNYYANLNKTDLKNDVSEFDYEEILEDEYHRFEDDPYFSDYKHELFNESDEKDFFEIQGLILSKRDESINDDLPF